MALSLERNEPRTFRSSDHSFTGTFVLNYKKSCETSFSVVLGLAVPKSPSSIMGQLFLLAPGVLHPVQLPFPVGILLPELQRNFGHPVPVT